MYTYMDAGADIKCSYTHTHTNTVHTQCGCQAAGDWKTMERDVKAADDFKQQLFPRLTWYTG